MDETIVNLQSESQSPSMTINIGKFLHLQLQGESSLFNKTIESISSRDRIFY